MSNTARFSHFRNSFGIFRRSEKIPGMAQRVSNIDRKRNSEEVVAHYLDKSWAGFRRIYLPKACGKNQVWVFIT